MRIDGNRRHFGQIWSTSTHSFSATPARNSFLVFKFGRIFSKNLTTASCTFLFKRYDLRRIAHFGYVLAEEVAGDDCAISLLALLGEASHTFGANFVLIWLMDRSGYTRRWRWKWKLFFRCLRWRGLWWPSSAPRWRRRAPSRCAGV